MKNKLRDSLKKHNLKTLGLTFSVVGMSLTYLLLQLLDINLDALDKFRIAFASVVAMFLGFIVKTIIGEIGFRKGYDSQEWKTSRSSYDDKCRKAMPYKKHAVTYNNKKREEELKNNRYIKLQSVRLLYDDFFDEKGNYKHHHIISARFYNWKNRYSRKQQKQLVWKLPENTFALDFEQKIALRKCVKMVVYIDDMFSEKERDIVISTKPRKTDKRLRTKHTIKNLFSSLGIAISGAIPFMLKSHIDFAQIIGASVQIACWIAIGLLQMSENERYVIEEKTEILKEKEMSLQEFVQIYGGEEKAKEIFIDSKEEKTVIDSSQEKENKTEEIVEIELTEDELKRLKENNKENNI